MEISASPLAGKEVIDVSNLVVSPGFIDPHVHIYLPFMGTFSKDDAVAKAHVSSWCSARPSKIASSYAGGDNVIGEKKLTVYWDNLTEESWTAGTRRVNCNLAALLPDRSGFAPVTGSVAAISSRTPPEPVLTRTRARPAHARSRQARRRTSPSPRRASARVSAVWVP